MMANWLRKLMPQQEKFFPMFNAHADMVQGAAGQLRTLLNTRQRDGGPTLDRFVSEGRETTGKILSELRSSFVTPFDRSDIKEMTSSMQSLLEDMQSVARSSGSSAGTRLDEFGALIGDCAGELKAGVAWLQEFEKHADELRRMRDRIADLRARMLVLREDAMLQLLTHGADDPMATLASSRLLESLGSVVERFDEVADHIDDLVLDHV